ncbi:MAG: arsenate reductase family protein [Acidimicrobiales bacterium]
MELWHNPRCSKSRSAKDILDSHGVDYTERRYLDDPPTAAELDRVLSDLGKEPWEILRRGEEVAKNLGLRDWPKNESARDRWIAAMVDNPILIERPILVTDDGRAVLGRPPEAVLSFFGRARRGSVDKERGR